MAQRVDARGAARFVGQSVKRNEDVRMVTGRGRYVDDVRLPDMLHAHFVRSPAARGTLSAVEVSDAAALPGVIAVLTAADLNREAHSFWVTMMGPDAGGAPMRVLADGDVRYVGEPIALIVAESRYLAEDAAELVGLEIDARPAVVTIEQALAAREKVHPELDSNVSFAIPELPSPALDELFAAADRVLTEKFSQHRYLNVPMEPRGLVASWDPWQQRMEVVASTQTAHEARAGWARLLETSPDDLRMAGSVISVKGDPDVSLPLAAVAATAYLNTDALPPGVPPGLEFTVRYKAPTFMFSNACHAVTVEVSPASGEVKILRYVVSEDCGNMINPMVVEGQIAGGIAQGIGGVFYEHFRYDADGNPLTTTFLDYQLPTADTVPDYEYGHVVTPAPTPGGFKGMGEGGAIASPPALINAVRDALAPFGVKLTAQPLTPEAIVRAIEEAR
jgi:CO/xanthine dehydrogenase Mo-binding subunit